VEGMEIEEKEKE